MRAFKFRASRDLHYSLDILLCNRLYCSHISVLNDILEGSLDVSELLNTSVSLKYARAAEAECKKLRVCCLTDTFHNALLWSHYAGGYDGFAFEVEIDEEDIWPVEYTDKPRTVAELVGDLSPSEFARTILATKRSAWSYERELRIICPFEYYKSSHPIVRTILGPRTPDVVAFAIHLLGEQFGVHTDWLQLQADGSMSTRPTKREEFEVRIRSPLGGAFGSRNLRFAPR